MKIFRWTTLLLFVLVLCGSCKKKETEAPALTYNDINGTWQLKSWTGEANNPDGTSYTFNDIIYVYVVLNADQTFELYQNVSALGAAKLTGSFTLDGSTIHGSYKTATGTTFWSDGNCRGFESGRQLFVKCCGGCAWRQNEFYRTFDCFKGSRE